MYESNIANKLETIFKKLIMYYPEKKIFALDGLLPHEREALSKIAKHLGFNGYEQIVSDFGWEVIGGDAVKKLRDKVIYIPGDEPHFMRDKIDNMLASLSSYYPNKVILQSIQKEHPKLGAKLSALYQWFGYENAYQFLLAYGYDYQAAKPLQTDFSLADEVVAILIKRYEGKRKPVSFLELKKANLDLKDKILFAQSVSTKYFGVTFEKHLERIGVLEDEKAYFQKWISTIQERYPNGTGLFSITTLCRNNPDWDIDAQRLGIICEKCYKKTFIQYLKEKGVLLDKKEYEGQLIANLSDFELNKAKNYIIRYLGKEKYVTIPACIKQISNGAFKNSAVEEIYFQEDSLLKKICEESFNGCKSLRKVDFSGVKERGIRIGKSAFKNCTILEEIAGGEKIKGIDVGAFEGAINTFVCDGEYIYPRLWLYNLMLNSIDGASNFDLEECVWTIEELPYVKIYNPYVKKNLEFMVKSCNIPIAARAGYGGVVTDACLIGAGDEYDDYIDILDETVEVWTDFYLPTRESVEVFLEQFELKIDIEEEFDTLSEDVNYSELQRKRFGHFIQETKVEQDERIKAGKKKELCYDFSVKRDIPTRKSVDVFFVGGQCYTYNTTVEVKIGDIVYVDGAKEGFLGEIVSEMGEWKDAEWMRMITAAYKHSSEGIFAGACYESTYAKVYPFLGGFRGREKKIKEHSQQVEEAKKTRTGFSKCRVRVKFDDGKSYAYNTKLTVCIGDKVKVEGKRAQEIGEVVAYEGSWSDSSYMLCIKKVVKESINTPEEIEAEIARRWWYDKNGRPKVYKKFYVDSDELIDLYAVKGPFEFILSTKENYTNVQDFSSEFVEADISYEAWSLCYKDQEICGLAFRTGVLDVNAFEIEDVQILAVKSEEMGEGFKISLLIQVEYKLKSLDNEDITAF